jgi:hypothetical protein
VYFRASLFGIVLDYDRTENMTPYSLFGDDSGDYYNGPVSLSVGIVSLTARPYSENDLLGTAGVEVTLMFTVINQPAATATPTDTPTSTPTPTDTPTHTATPTDTPSPNGTDLALTGGCTPSTVLPGGQVSCTFRLTNNGIIQYLRVTVQATIPITLSVFDDSITRSPGASSYQDYTLLNGSMVLTMGSLFSPFMPGEWIQIDYLLEVGSGVAPGTNYSIPISITTANPANPNPADNSITWNISVVSVLPTATPTPTPTGTPTSTNTSTPTPTATPTSVPTLTPTPTSVPTPTDTPTPTSTPVPQADVTMISLSPDVANPIVGQVFNLNLIYGVTAAYGPASGTVITFSFPAGLVCSDGSLACTTQPVGTLSPPGQSYILGIGVRLDSGAPGTVLTIGANISAAESDPVPGNNTASTQIIAQ